MEVDHIKRVEEEWEILDDPMLDRLRELGEGVAKHVYAEIATEPPTKREEMIEKVASEIGMANTLDELVELLAKHGVKIGENTKHKIREYYGLKNDLSDVTGRITAGFVLGIGSRERA